MSSKGPPQPNTRDFVPNPAEDLRGPLLQIPQTPTRISSGRCQVMATSTRLRTTPTRTTMPCRSRGEVCRTLHHAGKLYVVEGTWHHVRERQRPVERFHFAKPLQLSELTMECSRKIAGISSILGTQSILATRSMPTESSSGRRGAGRSRLSRNCRAAPTCLWRSPQPRHPNRLQHVTRLRVVRQG